MLKAPLNPDAPIGGIPTVKDGDVAPNARLNPSKIDFSSASTGIWPDLQAQLNALSARITALGG